MSSARQAWFRAALVLGCVVIVDQLSKRLIDSSISPGEEQRFLPGLQLVHSLNHGVAFSFSAGGDSVVLVVIAVAVVAIVAYFATHARRPLLWLPTGLMVGGALGNLFDRIRDGAVTDFLKVPLWPAFNLADVSITVGVLALIYLMQDPAARADADPGTS